MSLRSVLLYAASAGSWVFKGRAFTGPTGLSGFDSDTTDAKCDRGCGAMGEPVGLVAASNSNMDASTVSSACIGCCADSKYCDGGSGAEVWGKGKRTSLGRREWMLCEWVDFGSGGGAGWLCERAGPDIGRKDGRKSGGGGRRDAWRRGFIGLRKGKWW